MAKSATPDLLGSFEQLVLLAVVRLRDDAYGMTVRREISDRARREVSLGAVYATLDRLERKGFVASNSGSSGAARGGRARRFFEIRAKGRTALQHTLETLDHCREGLSGLEPSGATS